MSIKGITIHDPGVYAIERQFFVRRRQDCLSDHRGIAIGWFQILCRVVTKVNVFGRLEIEASIVTRGQLRVARGSTDLSVGRKVISPCISLLTVSQCTNDLS